MNMAYQAIKKLASHLPVIMVVGNHDITMRTKSDVNSVKNYCDIKDVTLVEKLSVMNFERKSMLLCPWGVNVLEIDRVYDYAAGHFEFNGAITSGTEVFRNSNVNMSDMAKLARTALFWSGQKPLRAWTRK